MSTDLVQVSEMPKDLYGSWMMVEKRRKPVKRANDYGGKENSNPNVGSQFTVIQDKNLRDGYGHMEVMSHGQQPLLLCDSNK